MNFTTQLITIVGIILTLILTLLIHWKVIKESVQHDDFSSLRNTLMSLKRRKFLVGFVSLVGIGTWTLLTSTYVNEKIKKLLLNFLPNSDMIVVNKRTGIMHHKVFCKGHLPKSENINQNITLNTTLKFHKTKKVEILTKLSENTSAEDAVEVLLLATENNSTSVHLYDKLVKLLGQLKRYESIHLLLNNAERKLTNELKSKIEGTKEYKNHLKALLHIQLQKNKILNRARYRALKI